MRAQIYAHGEGVTQCFVKVARWFKKAADQRYSGAISSNFWCSYAKDNSATQSCAMAASSLQKAADKELVEAREALYKMAQAGNLPKASRALTHDVCAKCHAKAPDLKMCPRYKAVAYFSRDCQLAPEVQARILAIFCAT